MVRRALYGSCIVCLLITVQSSLSAQQIDSAYWKVVYGRAEKITKSLSIESKATYQQVQNLIAGQYYHLNEIIDSADAHINRIKSSDAGEGKKKEKIADAEKVRDEKVDQLHKKYIEDLSVMLTKEQVGKVKDGMTYNVLPITYTAFLDMIPALTQNEKDTILLYLTEAREHAMDAGSSEKKHGWFGKYKGRINNYLSAHGYDLTKEREAWEKRRKESSAN